MVAYVRVSTDEQALSGLGLEGQEAALQRAADYRGFELVDVARDEGVSGSTIEREGLGWALQLIADRQADGLLVAKLDRLTRSMRDFCEVVDWFEEAEAALVVLEPDVDTSTSSGRAVAHVMVAFAEMERRMIGDRTRAALAAKRERGEAIGRPALADRPELVSRIKAMRETGDGMSYQAIADQLTAEGVPTARGAARWSASSVQVTLGWRRRPRPRRSAALPRLDRRRG
ncbi:MAG: hypothetical protein QOG35_1615 [Solirubrobacteraceae bacterium]|jgi:DNA invertase Pin-like site-specific DNA recombinase|nr:hypothetical protein [Solirubrobacteraceae bacterium]